MATYDELYDLLNNDAMRNKVRVAITEAADRIRSGDDDAAPFSQAAGAHDARTAWVKNKDAFNPSGDTVQRFWNAMLAAQTAGTSVATITGASDNSIQSNVDAVVDIFASGESV